MAKAFAMGLVFGTNSARALIVDPKNGREIATAVANYPSGSAGSATVTVATSVAVTTSVGPALNAVHSAELTVVMVTIAVCVMKVEAFGARVYGKLFRIVPSSLSSRSWRTSATSPVFSTE